MEYMIDGRPKPRATEPIKKQSDIRRIKEYLIATERWRDYCIFVVGCNTAFRAGDLLNLNVHQLEGKDTLEVIEQKTGKTRVVKLNQAARDAIALYLCHRGEYCSDEWMFPSKKCPGNHLTVRSLHKIIKTLLRQLGVSGNFGSHTLRRTFGFHVYTNNIRKNPGILTILQKLYNHVSAQTTLAYIGITQDVLDETYNELNL